MSSTPFMTVFTPAYNRAHTLPRLYASLQAQTVSDFEWLVVNDGSTDGTEQLLRQWAAEQNAFRLEYITVPNGGKPRAINKGVSLAKGQFFFLVDSDDYLLPDAVEKMTSRAREIQSMPEYVGVGAARGFTDKQYIKSSPPTVGALGYVDASNLERAKYNLDADMCEAYRLDVYRRYPYVTWEGEKFAPEQITMNEMALDGYKLRWYGDIIYICEYMEDGLTKNGASLEKHNPMGYAMMYNHALKYGYGFKKRLKLAANMTALALYGGHSEYLKESNSRVLTALSLPFGYALYRRRKKQFSKL